MEFLVVLTLLGGFLAPSAYFAMNGGLHVEIDSE